jgi:tRNA(Ile)-lysidine synthase
MGTIELVDEYLSDEFPQGIPSALMVGVSGGADSMALLHLLSELSARYEFKLYVLHLNHKLQEKALAGEELVRVASRRLGVEFIGASVFFSEKLYETRRGLEAEARDLRYGWFKKVAECLGACDLFLAHHCDDQVETVLLNMGRGCGIDGLEGMRERSVTASGLSLHRPLLKLSRSKLEKYCQQKNISFVQDPSNEDVSRARNRLRHRVLPEWEKAQPDPRRAISRLSRIVQRENDFWPGYFRDNFSFVEEEKEIRITVSEYSDEHVAGRLRFLHFIISRLAGDVNGWSERNFMQLDALFRSESGKKLSLPSGLKAIKEYDLVAVYYEMPELKPEKVKKTPFELSWGAGKLKIMPTYPRNTGIHYISFLNYVPRGEFIVRPWPLLLENGEVFAVPGFYPGAQEDKKAIVSFQTEEACFY